jgi:hypothetical protein
MRITSKTLAPVILIVFILGIGLSMAFNIWITESSKIPAIYESGEFSGVSNPADIRGSYKFSDIEKAFEIESSMLAAAFGMKDLENPEDFQIKGLEELYGATEDGGTIDTDAVRLFVARYKGLPYTAEDTTRLPSPAVNILKDKLAPADLEALRAISIQLDAVRVEEIANPDADEHVEVEAVIKGKTTFDELISWGLSADEIESILGMEMGPRALTVRDYLSEKGLEFSEYKIELQELLDSKNAAGL